MSDMAVALVRSLIGTADTTSISHTYSGFGYTPNLALGMMGFRSNVETVSAHAEFMFSAFHGTGADNGDVVYCGSDDAVATTATYRKRVEAGAGRGWYLGATGSGNRDGWGAPSSFGSDNVTWAVNNAVNANNNPFVTCMFGGTDYARDIQNFNPNATQNSATTLNFGFRPNVLILFSVATGATTTTTGGSHHNCEVGFVTDDGTTTRQCCFANWDDNNVAATTIYAIVKNDRCLAHISGSGTLDYTLECNNFTSTGCDFVTRDAAGDTTDDIGVIAIDLQNNLVATCGVIDGPTGTGPITYTATELPGLQDTPIFLMQFYSLLTSVNSVASNREAGGGGMRWATANEEYMHWFAIEDAADTTNNEHASHNKIFLHDHDGTAGLEGSLSSFGSAQFTENYTVRDAGVGTVKIPTLVISDDTGGAPAAPSSLPLLGVG